MDLVKPSRIICVFEDDVVHCTEGLLEGHLSEHNQTNDLMTLILEHNDRRKTQECASTENMPCSLLVFVSEPHGSDVGNPVVPDYIVFSVILSNLASFQESIHATLMTWMQARKAQIYAPYPVSSLYRTSVMESLISMPLLRVVHECLDGPDMRDAKSPSVVALLERPEPGCRAEPCTNTNNDAL